MTLAFPHTVLVIDDEAFVLSSLQRLLRKEFNVLLASSAQEGLELIKNHEVHVVISDQRMPGMVGVDLLSILRVEYPETVRMLLTGYADIESVIAAVNSGNIYRYLVKPWNPEELLWSLREACSRYDLVAQNQKLTKELMAANIELEGRVKDRTARLIRTNSFITTINEVAIQLQSALDLEQVKKTLETELERRGFCCLVALKDVSGEDGEHTFMDDFQIGQFISDKNCSMALTDIPAFKDLIEQRLSRYISDMQLWSNKLLESQVGQLPCSLSRLASISEVTSGAVLPLYAHQGFIGMLAIWGADIQKDDLSALTTFANQVSVIIENARFYESLKKLAEIDGLTGLLNQHTIFELAEREFKRARRLHKNMTVIMIDIDRFKQVNDTYGHGMGDKVLKVVANTLQQGIRKDVDSVGRYGGDEFVVVLPETCRTEGELVAGRLQTAIEACEITAQGHLIHVNISTGIASLNDESSNLDGLLDLADQAMYVAKRKRNIEARG